MSMMKELVTHIEEFSCDDARVARLLTWVINEHLQGKYKLEVLPKEAQLCLRLWEDEQQWNTHADKQAKEWEDQHKIDIHNKINFAVNNGVLTYDQGLELVNNPDKAEKWVAEGIL